MLIKTNTEIIMTYYYWTPVCVLADLVPILKIEDRVCGISLQQCLRLIELLRERYQTVDYLYCVDEVIIWSLDPT